MRRLADAVEALKARAQRRGMRNAALLRGILERAVRRQLTADGAELAQINQRLARIDAAIPGQGAPAPQVRRTRHADVET